jgi:hypothetical protein
MAASTQGNGTKFPLRSAPILAAITLILLPAALPVASSAYPIHGKDPASVPTSTKPQLQTHGSCGPAESVRRNIATIEVWPRRAEPTATLRAAIWVATAVITVSSIAVVAVFDQAPRYRRPARTGSKRWEAGWTRQVVHGWPVAVG